VVRWTEGDSPQWSDHSGDSADSQASAPVRIQIVALSTGEKKTLTQWFYNEPRTRSGRIHWHPASQQELAALRAQVTEREFKRALKHGTLLHQEGLPRRLFAGVNFGRARVKEGGATPTRNPFTALSAVPAEVQRQPTQQWVEVPSCGLAHPPGFSPIPRFPPSDSSESSDSTVSPERGSRSSRRKGKSSSSSSSNSSSSSCSSDGRKKKRGKAQRKKKKKKMHDKKQRRQKEREAVGKGEAVAEEWELTERMAVRALFKNKALRDQAFDCLPEERQQVIAEALSSGKEVRWEKEGWEALMATQTAVLKGKDSMAPPCPQAPTPEESELVWYDWTKAQHPTLNSDQAWQLAVANRTESGASPSKTGSGEASGSASSSKAAQSSQAEPWRNGGVHWCLSPWNRASGSMCGVTTLMPRRRWP